MGQETTREGALPPRRGARAPVDGGVASRPGRTVPVGTDGSRAAHGHEPVEMAACVGAFPHR